MGARIGVAVYAQDPVSRAGIASGLRTQAHVEVIEEGDGRQAEVSVVVVDAIDDGALRLLHAIQRNGCGRTVVVVSRVDEHSPLAAVGAGVCALLYRGEAHPELLGTVVRSAAAGDGRLPPDLLGRLLHQVSALQNQVLGPRGLTLSGLADREIEVLRLVADGLDTGEVARKLCYSERTVKNVLHSVTSRLGLRNRCHAVAWAIRQGLI